MHGGIQAEKKGGGSPLSSGERVKIIVTYALILSVTVVAFLTVFLFLPSRFSGEMGSGILVFTGLSITAYVLGLRHGFDADHIAAIDNTTRKLLNEGKSPLTVGMWFSLGHSTVVAAMVALFVIATEFIKSNYQSFAHVGTIVGTLVSGTFLFIIGLINVIIVLEVYRIFRGLRDGKLDQKALDEQMEKRGFLYRYFGKLFRVIEKPWQIYPVGVLFGLGFDTTTEVLLISFAVTFALSTTIPLWVVLVLPLLFGCGMVLSDTTDGFAMRYAYGWAFQNPVRKVYYNLTLTVISVMVAFVIGGVELLQLLSVEAGWNGPFWGWLTGLNFEEVGFGIVALFVGTWLIAMAIYRIKGYETPGIDPRPSSQGPPPT